MSNVKCPTCDRPLRCNSYSDEWTCDDGNQFRVSDSVHTFTTLYLAAHSLGPYAPKRPPYVEREHIPGFLWDPNEQCYVRIASDDEVAKSVAEDMRRWHVAGRPGWS